MPQHTISHQALPYYPDSSELFAAIRHMPFACWLDSGKPNSQSGRYDIISAMPAERIVTDGYLTQQYKLSKQENLTDTAFKQLKPFCSLYDYQKLAETTDNPFEIIKEALKPLNKYPKDQPNKLPFSGGAIGYFAYDLGRRDYPLSNQADERCDLPDMVIGIYHWAIVQDHELKTCFLVSLGECDENIIRQVNHQISLIPLLEKTNNPKESKAPFTIGTLSSNTSPEQYHQQLEKIDEYIHAGDCYQVNFSQCFSAAYQGDPFTAYRLLRDTMASPFSAYIDLGNKSILSLSPERFLQTEQDEVLTQPIKGTIARGETSEEDQENAAILRESEKNQAENVMIVDLLRNDLGKNCTPGSIQVPKLFELESFSNVHHLVSSVTGTISHDKTSIDVFRDSFPGGSITGAPKKRAMEIIEELESYRRSIYCGSIAYINYDGNLDSNIAIRTIACDDKKLYCWGGGGIVADSDIDEEYQESLTKIGSLLKILETFRET